LIAQRFDHHAKRIIEPQPRVAGSKHRPPSAG
jgi:hypothetical protein